MQYINNNSDFALDIALKAILPDGAELATAPPNCDFTLTFGTRYDEAKYEVGRYNGEPRGYTVNTDGSLHVIFDAHGLGLGRLGCMLTYGIPDSSYPDGVATVATSYELDVELIGWGADGQQSGTVTIATEAAAVGAAQQAQAAAERAAQAAAASQQAAQQAIDTANTAADNANTAAQAANTAADSASEYVERYDAIAGALPKVTDTFEGVAQDTGLRYVIRKNKLIAILKDGHVEYAPEGVIQIEATTSGSFKWDGKTFNFDEGLSFTELNQESEITSLTSCFSGNEAITKVSMHFDSSKLSTFQSIFLNCKYLTSVDLRSLDFSAIKSFAQLFSGCKNLIVEDISEWEAPNLTNIQEMFWHNYAYTELDISKLIKSAPNITNLDSTFRNLNNCKKLNLGGLPLSNVTIMIATFFGMYALTELDLSLFHPTKVTRVDYCFSESKQIHTLRFPHLGELGAESDTALTLSFVSPLGTAGEESLRAFKEMFTIDRYNDLGLTSVLTVSLHASSKALLSAEDIAAITAKGYTIA